MLTEEEKYSSHLYILEKIYKILPIESVLEFGMGFYSTTFFVENSKKITSIEMQTEDWFNKVKEKIKSDKWKGILSLGENSFRNLTFEDKYSLCFVDGINRADCINFLQNKTEIIVAHDTEAGCNWYNNVKLPKEFKIFDFNEKIPATTIYSKNEILNKAIIDDKF